MAGPTYFPSSSGLTALSAPLVVNTELTFDVGKPDTTDRAAKLVANFADIVYDQVVTFSVDVGVSAKMNDISAPAVGNLITLYKPDYDPADVYVVGILITCELGEAAIYLATDITTSDFFDPPDILGLVPIPLVEGGWFLHLNDHEYETAAWQTEDAQPVYVGEILAVTFRPSRITGYVFLKNLGE
jgi:hypothetical protein